MENKKAILISIICIIAVIIGCVFWYNADTQIEVDNPNNDNYLITVEDVGVSATGEDTLKYMNFDYETIKERVIQLLK